MSVKIVGHGVTIAKATFHAIGELPPAAPPTAQEGTPAPAPLPSNLDLPFSSSGNTTTIDLSTLGPRGGSPQIDLAISSVADGGTGSVTIPLAAPPGDRNRGWAQLHSSLHNVLAYQLFGQREDEVVLIAWPGPTDFMGALPDDWTLGDLSLCGTHESAALTGCMLRRSGGVG